MELQADAEHQEDDADFGELVGQVLVGGEAGGIRPDDQSREEISDDGGKAEPECHVATDEGRSQAAGERQDEVEVVHCPSLAVPEPYGTPPVSLGGESPDSSGEKGRLSHQTSV